MTNAGTVEAICITPASAEPMTSVDCVQAVAGQGLAGDRYSSAAGTFSRANEPKQQVTLIESETLEAAARDYELTINHGDTRRNILTRGVPLNHCVGREIAIGDDVILRSIELCEPCGHMQQLCKIEGARKALIHRGGLRCEIITGGPISVGDAVTPQD